MNLTYTKWDKELEVYYGILKNEVELIEEVNKLEWVNTSDNFFDMNRYAGEGNIGHIIEEILENARITTNYYIYIIIFLEEEAIFWHLFFLIIKYWNMKEFSYVFFERN